MIVEAVKKQTGQTYNKYVVCLSFANRKLKGSHVVREVQSCLDPDEIKAQASQLGIKSTGVLKLEDKLWKADLPKNYHELVALCKDD